MINGGFFKVSSAIENIGSAEATNINWQITLDGGTILMGKETVGQIPSLSPGNEIVINSDLIIGFGKTLVTITAELPEGTDIRQQDGFMYLIFVQINPSGT
jgi:hypothetical protein